MQKARRITKVEACKDSCKITLEPFYYGIDGHTECIDACAPSAKDSWLGVFWWLAASLWPVHCVGKTLYFGFWETSKRVTFFRVDTEKGAVVAMSIGIESERLDSWRRIKVGCLLDTLMGACRIPVYQQECEQVLIPMISGQLRSKEQKAQCRQILRERLRKTKEYRDYKGDDL